MTDGDPPPRRRRARLRPEERTVPAPDGTVLNVAEGGDRSRPPLLVLHGLAARWQAFSPLIRPLWQAWHVIAPDFRGHGGSGHAPGTYRLPTLVADTDAVATACAGDAPLVIHGHSLGGWVALQLAAEQPGRVRGLVVGDTAIDPSGVDPDFAVNYLEGTGIALQSLNTSMAQLDPEVMAAFRSGDFVAGYDPVAVLERVRCPVLLLQADPAEDGLMSDADVALAEAHLADVTHHRLAGVGHGMQIHDPSAVLAIVEPFLDALPPRAPDGRRTREDHEL